MTQPAYAPWPASSECLYPPIKASAPAVESKPETDEQIKAFLQGYDFFILIDKSSSMKWDVSEGCGVSRWNETRECLKRIASESANYDPNGVDVCFFGAHTEWHENIESAKKVDMLFNKITPRGSTNLTEALEETFEKHIKKRSKDPNQKSIVLVITDGCSDDEDATAKAIKEFTKSGLDKSRFFEYVDSLGEITNKTKEFGIRFFQVGEDEEATEFLKSLDTKLRTKVDIVATGNIDELQSTSSIRKAFLQAIYD
jgi:DUF2075 family protein